MPQRDCGLILRARVVLPVCRPPIDNGAIFVSGGRIVSVGPETQLEAPTSTPVVDLGDSILLPGLVNAHCHLDYTDLGGSLEPGASFTDWLRRIIDAKSGWSQADYSRSWKRGAEMLVRSGVTTVADIEAAPSLLPGVWSETPVTVCSFLEMTGVRAGAAQEAVLSDARATLGRVAGGRGEIGLSPHSLYSTVPGLVASTVETAHELNLPLTMHLAESGEEFEMFRDAGGPMFAWLKDVGRDMADCGRATPVQIAAQLGALDRRMLAVHVNRLGPEDARLLGRGGASVAHCPGSHEFFGHSKFEFSRLAAAGVNICLGTDSLASIGQEDGERPVLCMFAEMRRFAGMFPDIGPDEIVKMATANGARALGKAGEIGELSGGAAADLLSIPFAGASAEAADAVVHHRGNASGVMIGGDWARPHDS